MMEFQDLLNRSKMRTSNRCSTTTTYLELCAFLYRNKTPLCVRIAVERIITIPLSAILGKKKRKFR